MDEKKELVPDPGIGYKGSYTNKKTGEAVGFLKVSLRKSIIDALPVTDRGTIELTLFAITGPKKSDKSPDYVVKPRIVSNKGAASAGQTATDSGSGLPF